MESTPWLEAVEALAKELDSEDHAELIRVVVHPHFLFLLRMARESLVYLANQHIAVEQETGGGYVIEECVLDEHEQAIADATISTLQGEEGPIDPFVVMDLRSILHQAIHYAHRRLRWCDLTHGEKAIAVPAAIAAMAHGRKADDPYVPLDAHPLPDSLNFIVWFCRDHDPLIDEENAT